MKYILLSVLFFCAHLLNAQETYDKEFILPDPKEEIPISENKPMSNAKSDIDYSILYHQAVNPSYYHLNVNSGGGVYDLKNNLSYMLYSNQNVLNGFGSSYEAGGMLIYQPFDKLTFSLGAGGAKYSMNGQSYTDYIFNAGMTYKFNHWLKLHLYGQHSLHSQKNALAGGYYLSPQSCYGAILIIKVMDEKKYSVDMNIGAERTFNPLNKQWEMNYRLGPEIRIK